MVLMNCISVFVILLLHHNDGAKIGQHWLRESSYVYIYLYLIVIYTNLQLSSDFLFFTAFSNAQNNCLKFFIIFSFLIQNNNGTFLVTIVINSYN